MRTILVTSLAVLVAAVPAAGARHFQLVAIASAPDWSPDGTSIAYAQTVPGPFNTRSELIVASTRTGVRRTLAGDAYLPRWSPDGNRLAYVGTDPSSGDVNVLRVISALGGSSTVVAREIGTFAWSPDGSELLYDHAALTCSQIEAAHVSDPTATRVLVRGSMPVPSPNGKLLAYLSPPGVCTGSIGSVSVANADGTNAHVVFEDPVTRIAWSPDSKRLAVQAATPGRSPIVVLNADGSNQFIAAFGTNPSWSPDGTRLAYASIPVANAPFPRDEPYLQVVDLRTSISGARLVSASAELRGGPEWSPDGRAIALSRALERGGVSEGVAAGLNRYVSLYVVPPAHPAAARRISIAACQLLRPACTLAGGPGGDVLVGTRRTDVIWGYGGDDRIAGGAGNDDLHGGSGNDLLTGGAGDDSVSGGSGRDLVFARDGTADRVYCGSGYDVVIADRVDAVARDCERVVRA